MAGYYDQLETQLAQLTERGVQRQWLSNPFQRPRRHRPKLAAAVAVAVSLGVSALVVMFALTAGTRYARPLHATHPPTTRHSRQPPVIRNFWPAALPPHTGQMVCDTDLTPHGHNTASGTGWIYTDPPTTFVLSITAHGLKPTPPGDVYAIWFVQNAYAPHAASLIGIVSPPIGRDGQLRTQTVVPAIAGNELLITLQPATMLTTPGPVVLSGPTG